MATTTGNITEFSGPNLQDVFTQAATWAQKHDNGVLTALACVITYEQDDFGVHGSEVIRFSLVTQDCGQLDCCAT